MLLTPQVRAANLPAVCGAGEGKDEGVNTNPPAGIRGGRGVVRNPGVRSLSQVRTDNAS